MSGAELPEHYRAGRMVSATGDHFYPDSPDEAQYFREFHDAEFEGYCVNPNFGPVPCTCSCWGCEYDGGCWRQSPGAPVAEGPGITG